MPNEYGELLRRKGEAHEAAYNRRVRAAFEVAIAASPPTEPYPVEHCALCEFRRVCDER